MIFMIGAVITMIQKTLSTRIKPHPGGSGVLMFECHNQNHRTS